MMGFDITISATIFNLLAWIGMGATPNGWVWDTFLLAAILLMPACQLC